MIIPDKKPFIFGLWALFCLCFLFFSYTPVQALNSNVRQVKVKNNPTVYYLYQAGHRKKAYLNADTYLDYGNQWSDVKTISASELNSWPEAKLIREKGTNGIYYIKNNKKTLIAAPSDLREYALANEPVISVSQTDLNQYLTVSNVQNSGSGASVTKARINITNDLVTSTDNTILTGSTNNLIGLFRFNSPAQVASITSVTFDFGGLYNGAPLKTLNIFDENGVKYNANMIVRNNDNQIIVNFRDPVIINPGEEKTMKVYLDTNSSLNSNQTIRIKIKDASSIISNLTPAASFPLLGTEFKLQGGGSYLGLIRSQKVAISSNSVVPTGTYLIGKFILTEDTGHEDVVVTDMIFRNSGSAGKNDWENFSLALDDQIIARASTLNSKNDIEFNINYLRVTNGVPAVLTVTASTKTDYNPGVTANLQLTNLTSTGTNFKISLSPQLINLDDNIVLH